MVIIFDSTMSKKNHGRAKTAAVNIIEELKRNNDIVINNYILIPFDQGIGISFILLQVFI